MRDRLKSVWSPKTFEVLFGTSDNTGVLANNGLLYNKTNFSDAAADATHNGGYGTVLDKSESVLDFNGSGDGIAKNLHAIAQTAFYAKIFNGEMISDSAKGEINPGNIDFTAQLKTTFQSFTVELNGEKYLGVCGGVTGKSFDECGKAVHFFKMEADGCPAEKEIAFKVNLADAQKLNNVTEANLKALFATRIKQSIINSSIIISNGTEFVQENYSSSSIVVFRYFRNHF